MSIKITNDHTDEIIKALKEASKKALMEVGMEASGDVAEFMTDKGIVDTGLLRNSITFALDGESAQIGSYQSGNTNKKGKPVPVVKGSYTGTAPKTENRTVYIGTNVEYAKYVQYGTSKQTAQDFMFAPLRANLEKYRQIIQNYL